MQYKGALRYANKALAIDPSHVASLNTRTSTLLHMDKKEDSLKASAEALREAPNNAYSHCNAGWNLLEKGKTNKAMTHFREALSIDPNFNYAKEGMIEALKTKNDFYYFYLKCSDWINNSYSYAPRVLLVICFICFKMIGNFTLGERLGLSIVLPALALVNFFLYTKMVMPPFSNLFLRLNSYAKHLFDKTDIIVSNFVGISFLVFLSGIILYFIFGGVG